LTALAVIKFILGGLYAITAIGFAVLFPFLGTVLEENSGEIPPQQMAQIEAMNEVGVPLFIVIALISLATAVLLIASGVGYLKLRKFLGRTLGNSSAVVGVIYAVAAAMLLPAELGGGFNIAAIINLIYPVLTLILLNTTFKEDFVN
jgi:hypothetical protein